MAYSYIEYTANGSTTTFSIPFTYTQQADVAVFVGGTSTSFTFASASTISLSTAPANGVIVRIARTTVITSRAVDFSNGAILTESDLDNSNIQVFQAAQEAIDTAAASIFKAADGKFDAQSRVIKNVADPVNAQDAVTKTWAETGATSQLSLATAQAVISTDKATISTDKATISTDKASDSADSASLAQDWAEKTDGVVTGTSYSAKHWATTGTVATVSGAITNVNTVAGIETDVTTVAGKSSEITLLGTADVVADMNTLATAAIVEDMNILATADVVADMNTLATADVVADMNILGTADVVADMNTLATAAIVTDMSILATADIVEDLSILGTSAVVTNMSTIVTNLAAIQGASAAASLASNSAASLVGALDNFDDKYLGAKSSEPSVDNDGDALVTGSLYFLTGTGMQVYDGANWIAASSSGNVSLYSYEYIATAGQRIFSGTDVNGQTLSYTANNIHVTYGGLDIPKADYVATNGTTVVLDDDAVVGTIVRIVAFQSFVVANTYTQAQTNSLLDAKLDDSQVGTTANKLVALDGTAKLPAVDGSQLTGLVGGGPSLGTNSIVRTNAKVIAENITFSNQNGMTIGPITVNSGYTVTVDSGSTWVIL